ncbi:hypothetical protein AAVH_20270 [Aphelenchoides avenae]|nr:hypothetical protein AAVH_20270 [Aphelenchus avenae]
MKAGYIAIVVLSLTAHSLADGDGSTGSQCVIKCLWPESADSGVARSASAFRQLASEDSRCTDTEKVITCVEACPSGKYVTLAREVHRIFNKYCADGADQAAKEKFFADNTRFQQAWFSAREKEKCQEVATTPERACALASSCVFGSALTAVRNDFPDDVVSINVIWDKISYVATVEASYGESLPSSCGLLFEPNVPEPPYQPPYPYEPYHAEPYPYESYQRNAYQHNSYQRNPYQRNPYQRNTYQRNSYRRNPYKRRH